MNVHTVQGGGGTKLRVKEWGNERGHPILFIHGFFAESALLQMQYESPALQDFRLVALDLRGHGESEAPANAEAYTRADPWADDIAAIIRVLELKKPVLVGWSYGGFIFLTTCASTVRRTLEASTSWEPRWLSARRLLGP